MISRPPAQQPNPDAEHGSTADPVEDRARAIDKAANLIEALPWLSRFHGRTVVVKYGGNAMVSEELRVRFAESIVFLHYAGLRPVVVHGGGPQISAELDRAGVESTFTAGLRVTTDEAMNIVRMVLTGQVNREIVGLVNQHGPFAVGVSGEDANILTAERKTVTVDGETVDIGRVGEVTAVDPGAVAALLADGRIPVVSSVARADDGGVYNVNADTAASALAVALGASKLIMLTDVEGLFADYPDNTELISRLNVDELRSLLPTLSSGMLPKMEACLHAVEGGVPQAHIIDGRVPHSLLLEVFTDQGVGTMVADEELEAALLAGNGHHPRPWRPTDTTTHSTGGVK
ncbi:acetylglutamate kinase [Nocardiopsis lucentensis]|uniref:acetylglutamate kinase n=1 Tax=Nocardiopsis lucentensis TaxID=53441 RepID=UPI00034C6786|nr:acetylglutamate kinase [Nocardiopsis lucentensis]